MGDQTLRELERRFRETGSPDDELEWLAEKLRSGELAFPFRWTQSNGGPVIVLERAGLPHWGGCSEFENLEVPDDYDRACESVEPWIRVGPSTGLILNEPSFEVGGCSFQEDVVLLQASCPPEAELDLARLVCEQLRIARTDPESLPRSEPSFDLLVGEDTHLFAFDAAYSGEDCMLDPGDQEERLPTFVVPCKAGRYRVHPTTLHFSEEWGEAYVYYWIRQSAAPQTFNPID